MSEFTFRLVTPQRLLFEGPVSYVSAPGSEGYLGILAHHAPLITALRPGKLDVKDPEGVLTTYAVSGGFLEVSDNRASALADAAERVTEIDRARATAAFERAQARLRTNGEKIDAFDRDRAQRALERAQNRLALRDSAKRG